MRLLPLLAMSLGDPLGLHQQVTTLVFLCLSCSQQTLNVQQRPSSSLPARRDSPSPRRYTPYDSYSPHDGSSYRDDYVNVYRPNAYRPEYPSNFYSRSPSPVRFNDLPRVRTCNLPPWEAPPDPPVWGELRSPKKYIPGGRFNPSPPLAFRFNEMLATRMFEPSDSWKQNHVDRPFRIDT